MTGVGHGDSPPHRPYRCRISPKFEGLAIYLHYLTQFPVQRPCLTIERRDLSFRQNPPHIGRRERGKNTTESRSVLENCINHRLYSFLLRRRPARRRRAARHRFDPGPGQPRPGRRGAEGPTHRGSPRRSTCRPRGPGDGQHAGIWSATSRGARHVSVTPGGRIARAVQSVLHRRDARRPRPRRVLAAYGNDAVETGIGGSTPFIAEFARTFLGAAVRRRRRPGRPLVRHRREPAQLDFHMDVCCRSSSSTFP